MNCRNSLMIASLAGLSLIAGCQQQSKMPDVKASIEQSLKQAGLRDVSVDQDRDKGLITLTGTVNSDTDRTQAESIAKSTAGSAVIANKIAVRPPGNEGVAKDVDSALDGAIEKNVKATLIRHRWNKKIRYDVKNGVVTLKGSVNSQAQRSDIEKVVATTPNVRQVVNEIEVKNQKATSTSGAQ